MRSFTFANSLSAGSLFLALLTSPVAAATDKYQLVENWHGDTFLDYFNFHVGGDPTKGFVQYVDEQSARDAGLLRVTETGSVYIGVDYKTTLKPTDKGRESVRIGTKKFYDHSLVIADLAHMPASTCGTWPAFWSVGQNWPHDGEIDIIEGVNMQAHNEIVMHTAGTCSIADAGMTGSVNATGCGEDLGTVGCKVEGHEGSYGTSFNKQGGGVYAMEWTETFVKIWFFPRASIPASITSGQPDTTEFGTPMALVQEACDVASSFKAQSFTFDTTFCGEWAGGVYGQSGCPMSGSDSISSCVNYVAQNPTAFEQSYWEINSVKIYQTGVAANAVLQPAPTLSSAHSTVQEATIHSAATHTTEALQAAHTTQAASVPEIPQTTPAVASAASASHATAGASGETAYRSAPGSAIETLAGQDSNSAPTKTAAAEANQPATTAGTVGQLGGNDSSVGEQPAKQFITKFVTSTTTLCPIAEASASAAQAAMHSAASGVPGPSNNAAHVPVTAPVEPTHVNPETQTAAVVTIMSIPSAIHSSSAQVPGTMATGAPNGADAISASASGFSSKSDRPLPTIIPAPGVSITPISSAHVVVASHTQPAPVAIATASNVDAAGASSISSSSTAAAPVFTPFTGAAGRTSVQLLSVIATFMLAMIVY
ncbi:Endo-1,3(4)-beta-glucanase [Penicillium ucsense]|uniref:endo-1,3(4)-beta-glucanase n=1 Tax=Penicillium ucsense TaxID=2839758 RepID=A0A8J8W844_9EURO|nr:Endo-1,3(4)-beta-glucanase [Penicillium ucsense]KAF7733764.1 Endo-1,3(4)-beta-glucanase [Penicillium ucsense]